MNLINIIMPTSIKILNSELKGAFIIAPESIAPNIEIPVKIYINNNKQPVQPIPLDFITTAPEPHLGQRRQPLTMYNS
ncbi:hypothetical protein [Staphylococcus cohnii]|uniref:hypothetical protein n=1 Tax=Staphylococcus cohnii TaxID=29382 RepID=UPI003CF54D38